MRKGLLLICTLICTNVLMAQTQFTIGNLTYQTTSSSEAKVLRFDDTTSTAIIIPSTVTYLGITYNVTAIGTYAFANYGNSNITSVTIPNSVTTIDHGAFQGSSLTSINIPNSVTSIGSYAFGGCNSLTSINIPNSVTSIESCAFSGCSSLVSINIPNSVTSIETSAFSGCSSLVSINIPNSVTSIEGSAFSECSSLVSINIPNSVTSIRSYAFYGCSSLVSINIPNSVTYIGEYAFSECSSLTSINIPNSVTYIGEYAFNGVKLITYHGTATGSPWGALSVNGYVENGFIYHDDTKELLVGYIGSETNVVIPNDVIYIGDYAFYRYDSLISVTIPNSVVFIGSRAFKNCSNLISVIISDSITSIEYETFSNCSSLTSITIPNNVTSIGISVFNGCSSLTSITIPNNVTSIDSCAFKDCSSLTSITIPNNVTSIGYNAFYGCDSLTTINFNAVNCSDFNNITNWYHPPFINCPINTINIGDSVRRIPAYFAYDLDSLTSITIPNTVTNIGEQAFYSCNNLSLVNIPNTVTTIGYDAFYQVNSIIYSGTATGSPWGAYVRYGVVEDDFAYSDSTKTTLIKYFGSQPNVSIPNSVTTIGNSAFNGCNNLTSVTIPSSVTSIENGAFSGCTSLTTLNFNAINCNDFFTYYSHPFANCPISTINIGDSVQRIPNYFAYNLSSLASVIIPNSVTSIGNSAFNGCINLASITIHDSIDNIGIYAFTSTAYYENNANWESNLLYLNNWIIAARTTSIGEYIIKNNTRGIAYYAFQNCIVETINSESLIPPIISGGSTGLGINNLFTVNVSCQALSAYLSNPDWMVLNVQAIPYNVELLVNNPDMGSVSLTNNTCGNTTIQAYPNQGYAFKQWSDGNTENPRSVILTCDTAFVAIFEAMKTVSVSSVNETMGTTIGGGEYELNSSATVAAVPNNGYRFTNWNNNSTINPYTFTVTRDTNLVAYFEEIIPDTAFVHDTTYVPVHDTTYINIHDTTYVPVHDTTYITQIDTVTNTVYDTITNTVYDTITNTVYDTTYVPIHDTTYITQIDTVTNTVYDTITNTVHDTVTNTVYDTVTNTVYDTIDNFVYDTVYITETDTLWLFDTIYMHDTIYIYDTIYIRDSTTGIEDVSVINAKIYSSRSRIVVEGADGNSVMLFDMQGRLLSTKRDEYSVLEFEVPISGAYFVKIGNYKAKKVVVIK